MAYKLLLHKYEFYEVTDLALNFLRFYLVYRKK